MMYNFASNNQGLTLNPLVSSIINQRIHSSSNVSLFKKPISEQILTYANTVLTNIKTYCTEHLPIFKKSPAGPESNCILHQYEGLNFSPHPSNLLVFPMKNHSFVQLDWRNRPIIAVTDTQKQVKHLLKNPRSQHLYNQIRTFTSEKTTKEESIKAESIKTDSIKTDSIKVDSIKAETVKEESFRDVLKPKSFRSILSNRIKTFFGLGEKDFKTTKMSNVRKDIIQNFQEQISKENLTPKQSQRVVLAFAEGYIAAKEAVHQKAPWKLYHFIFLAGSIILLLYIIKKGSISVFFNSSNHSLEVSETNVKFSDVKGADEAKQELKNVVEFLKHPEKFSALGGKLPKGVLLVGPPGTGKTLLAKAVAGEAGVPFFRTSGAEFDEIYVGVGARRIRELFKLAKENIPCVIFIDEIDSIGRERTSSSLHPHANDTINQLLSEMDGFTNSGGIIVLGATNRKEDLDKALMRPGRFDVEVMVSVPDYSGRKELLEFYIKQIRSQNVDVERLARGTTNFTGADIENMVNQAALRAAVIGAKFVTMEHLEYARDKALMGPESMSRISDEETNRITAYHEGGHTVVAYFTEHSQPLHKVTIIARGGSLGHTAYIPDKDIYHITKTQLLAMLDSMMGGRAAEELVFGSEKITSGASSDLEKATELATKMVKKWGMSDKVGLSTFNSHSKASPQTSNIIDMEVKRILQESYERAKNILIRYSDKHRALSEALLEYETLDAEEIAEIMKGNKNFKQKKKSFNLNDLD